MNLGSHAFAHLILFLYLFERQSLEIVAAAFYRSIDYHSNDIYLLWCIENNFYRAMLCIRGTSHGPVSVCLCLSVRLSATSRSSTKTAKHRISQTKPHDTTGTLVFWSQRSPRNSTGVTPYEGAECRWGGSKLATFDKYWLYLDNGTRETHSFIVVYQLWRIIHTFLLQTL